MCASSVVLMELIVSKSDLLGSSHMSSVLATGCVLAWAEGDNDLLGETLVEGMIVVAAAGPLAEPEGVALSDREDGPGLLAATVVAGCTLAAEVGWSTAGSENSWRDRAASTISFSRSSFSVSSSTYSDSDLPSLDLLFSTLCLD